MEKLIILLVAICAYGISTVHAQQDSTLRKTDPSEANQPGVPKGYVSLRPEEIPSQLQTTLQAPAYSGWEQGFIYQNRRNSQYLVVIRTPGPDTRRYVFDLNGNPVKENEVKTKP
jgi:hypothetical protein